jgi:uncharacterized protein YjbI with pentapeptide repeats
MGRKKLVRKPEPDRKIAWPRWTGFRGMTLRNWLELLVVPFALVVIGFLFTMQQDARQQKIEDRRAREAQQIENQRAEAERELAEQRAQDEALQAYLHQMNNLLLAHNLRDSEPNDEVRTLARARTLTVLITLDPSRKTAVINFLAEANLISTSPYPQGVGARTTVIELTGADLSGTDLSNMYLVHTTLLEADLREANLNGTNLRGANLTKANLTNATLRNTTLGHAGLLQADLRDANLRDANVGPANLSAANLSNADLRNTGLRYSGFVDANLSNADLREASLIGANLSNADLRGADLTDAHVSEQQLRSAASLEGATMPDGQTLKSDANPDGPNFEEWLKSKGSREDGENSGSS